MIMILIDTIERRLRSLGYDPVRTFDPRRGWRLALGDHVIAEAGSISELAVAAHDWLTRHGRARVPLSTGG